MNTEQPNTNNNPNLIDEPSENPAGPMLDQANEDIFPDSPEATKAKIPLSYVDPLIALLLRKLAWENDPATTPVPRLKTKLKVKGITGDLINSARQELGFKSVSRGPSSDFYNQQLKNTYIEQDEILRPIQKEWRSSWRWRLLKLPSHYYVRYVSKDPIICEENHNGNCIEYTIALRDPALPRLKVFVGKGKPSGNAFGERRGVYFLRLPKHFYIGKSDEYAVRLGQHLKGKNSEALWWMFITPEKDDKTFTFDALGASESLLISFWNEVCQLANSKAGADKEPAFAYLQQAILFVTAASSVLIWVMRDNPTQDHGLKLEDCQSLFKQPSSSTGKNWPQCYLDSPLSTNESNSPTILTIPSVSSPQ